MAHLYPLSTNLKLVFFYNTCSFVLWLCCFCRFLILLPLVGRKFLPGGIADFFHIVSLLPLCGFFIKKTLIKSKLQVSDAWSLANGVRMVWVCYGVIFPHPGIAKHTSYSLLILSWCLMNVVHFAYYSFKVKTRSTPSWLFWLQYHHFYLTFPLTMVAEMVLIFLSLAFVKQDHMYEMFLQAALLSYIPAGYFAWGYLQSRKSCKYDSIIEKRTQRSSNQQQEQNRTVASSISSRNQYAVDEHELRDVSSNQ